MTPGMTAGMTAGTPTSGRVARRSRRLATTAVLALALSACAGNTSDEADDEESPTSTPSPTASVETPDEVETTEPGTELRFGESAVVEHTVRRQGTLLDIRVRSARRGALRDFGGFNLADPYQRRAHYYYVRVRVDNVGEDRLGGVDVPLWGISGDNTLLPPVQFTSSFRQCPTEPLPRRFRPGDTHRTCLVFLSPNRGTLEGVSYRPEESFDPIEWRGRVQTPGRGNGGNNQGGNNQGGNNRGGGDD